MNKILKLYHTIKKYFYYKDGKLLNRRTRSSRALVGEESGWVDAHGYRNVCLLKRYYKVHRLIFLLHYGYLPVEVDHKDNDRLNNKPENLRDASSHNNSCNSSTPKTNTSGYKGVSWDKSRGKWQVKIQQHGITKHFGRYRLKYKAIEACRKAREELHGEFCNHGT